MNMLKTGLAAAALASTLGAQSVMAVDFDVTITNLSRGLYFTPLLVAAHPESESLFSVGSAASAELQAMAEGGSIADLEAALTTAGATQSNNPAAGLLLPGASATATLNTDAAAANTHLSVVGMILPSNDGFIGFNSIEIPTEPGVYTFNINAYDAGTEANDELRGGGAPGVAGMPVPPPLDPQLGNGGTGVTLNAEGMVHIHRGQLG